MVGKVSSSLDPLAEQYVKLVLAVGIHDPNYVDAYYGPSDWPADAKRRARPLDELHAEAAEIESGFRQAASGDDPVERLRLVYLRSQSLALRGRIEFLQGARM